MNKIRQFFKSVPVYGWILGAGVITIQYIFYLFANWLSPIIGTSAWAFCPKIPAIDDRIPFVPVFMLIYIYSYIFWITGPIIASLTEKRNFINYLYMLLATWVICFLLLLFLPTYIDREAEGVLEYAARPGILNWMSRVIYTADGGRYGYNLFPSLHCISSMNCYLAIRRRPEISRDIRVYSAVMVVLIALSTVFTKQHYFMDVVSGLVIPVLCYIIVWKIDPGSRLMEKKKAGPEGPAGEP